MSLAMLEATGAQLVPVADTRMVHIGRMIRHARRRRRLTQVEVARWAGIGARAVVELECGNRDGLAVATFFKILDIVGLATRFELRD